MNLTKRAIEALPVPSAGRARYLDDRTRGLGVMVQPSGNRSFYWFRKVRGYPRWETLGQFPDLTVEQARDAAEALNNKLAVWTASGYSGPNPFERRTEVTLDGLLDDYIEKQVKPHSKRPLRAEKDVRSLVSRYLASWRGRPISALQREDVTAVHRKVGAQHQRTANVVVKTISTLYNFAERENLFDGKNPARGIMLFREQSRTRFLQPHEFPALGAAIERSPNPDLRDLVGLALLTGIRKMDILGARWQDIALDESRWVIPDPKSRRPYSVPLSSEAREILANRLRLRIDENPWLFPSYRKTKTGHLTDLKKRWKEALKAAGLEGKDLRFHDLRRTQGSYQAAQGTSLLIIGKSLGHANASSTQIYSQVNLDAVRESMERANSTITSLMKPKPKLLEAPKRKRARRG